jgi:DNA repair exonuclease SbcCD ATPase subunit
MIVIKKVKLINFTSAREIKYKFDRPGLNTIQGLNGVGKTTIFNGLVWVLYGITLKKGCTVEPWPELITKDYEGLRGSVDILKDGVEIQIIRTSEYKGKVKGKKMKSGIMILENGVINEKLRGKVDAQRYIQEILGYTPDLFKNSVVFGQRLKRLMEEDNATKKKIMEEAFEISFLAKAKDLVEVKSDELRQKIKDLDVKIDLNTSKLDSNTQHLKELTQVFEKFSTTKAKAKIETQDKINECRAKMKDLKPKLPKLDRLRENLEGLKSYSLESLRDEEFRLDLLIENTKGDVERIGGKIKELKESFINPCTKCEYCGGDLKQEFVKSYKDNIKREITKLKAQIPELQKTIDEKSWRYAEVKKELSSLSKKEDERTKIKLRIKELEHFENEYHRNKNYIKVHKENLKKIKESVCSITPKQLAKAEEDITVTKETIKTLETQKKKVSKELDTMNWLLKDALSNGGMKAFIIESMIGYVNKELTRLKSLIGFEIKLAVNLDSAHKDIKIRVFKGDFEKPYEDLSGGQKQLVDVAIAFAMNKIVENSKPINILLLDEAFESLDENNIEVVSKILQDRALNKSIHLITHLKQFNPVNSYQTKVIMKDGLTIIDSKMSQN